MRHDNGVYTNLHLRIYTFIRNWTYSTDCNPFRAFLHREWSSHVKKCFFFIKIIVCNSSLKASNWIEYMNFVKRNITSYLDLALAYRVSFGYCSENHMRISASACNNRKKRQPTRCQMADRWVPKFGTHFFFPVVYSARRFEFWT